MNLYLINRSICCTKKNHRHMWWAPYGRSSSSYIREFKRMAVQNLAEHRPASEKSAIDIMSFVPENASTSCMDVWPTNTSYKQFPVVPEPTRAAISSYLSYQYRKATNGVFVGQTSIQDVDAFSGTKDMISFLMISIALFSDAGRCSAKFWTAILLNSLI